MNIQTEDGQVWKAKCVRERGHLARTVRHSAGQLLISRAQPRRARIHLDTCPAEVICNMPAKAAKMRALPFNPLLRVRYTHARIPRRSFAVFLQVALRREKVRPCQWQRSGLCRCAKSLRVGH